MPNRATAARCNTIVSRAGGSAEINALMAELFATQTMDELVAAGQSRGVPVAAVLSPAETLGSAHFRSVGALTDMTIAPGVDVTVPVGPFVVDGRHVGFTQSASSVAAHEPHWLTSRSDQPVAAEVAVANRPFDGVRILVPNGMVLRNPLVNLTISGTRRTRFEVGVAYGTDLNLATRVAAQAAAAVPGVERQPPADAVLTELGGSSVNMLVRYWHSPRTSDLFHLRDQVIKAVVAALDAEGIEIPFEQRVLHVKQPSELQLQD